jgi:hypothetical protein
MADIDFKQKVMNVVIFISIVILVITTVFNIHLLFIEEPDYRSFYKPQYERNVDCNYSSLEIDACYENNGQIIYKNDCSIECDYSYLEQQETTKKINEQKAWFRIIFALVLLLVFGYINFKDKLIQYGLIIGSLISLVVATIIAVGAINQKIFPIVTIVELVVILILYKTLFKK